MPEELIALGEAVGRAGHGVFQLISDHQGGAADREWLVDLVDRTGITATYTLAQAGHAPDAWREAVRSDENTSELQSPMRISYAVFCLKTHKPTSTSLTVHTQSGD